MTVGFTTGPILDDAEMRARGIDAIPSTPFEGQDWFGLTRQLGRYLQNLPDPDVRGAPNVAGNIDLSSGRPLNPDLAPPAPPLSAAEATAKYGIDGELEFDNPIPESVALSLYEAKRDELARQDAARRAPAGFASGAERFGAGFVANALDPLNVAASFIPVVGEARYASWLAGAGSALGRAGVRAGVGAAQGAVGQVPLSALRYSLSQQEQADYSAADALTDIAYGGLLGGGLHAFGGALHDGLYGGFRGSDAAQIADADLPTREAAMRSAVAQLADGRPVEVRPAFDAGLRRELLSGTTLGRRPELPGESLFDRAEPETVPPIADAAEPAAEPTPAIGAAMSRGGAITAFDTEAAALKAADRLGKRGDQVAVAPDPAGGFVLTRQLDGQPLRNPDGTALSFATERAAERFTRTAPAMAGRDLTVLPFGAAGARRYAVIEAASVRDVAGLRARPDLADLGRSADRSAGSAANPAAAKEAEPSGAAPAAFRGAGAGAARNGLDEALRYAGGRPLPEDARISAMADRASEAGKRPAPAAAAGAAERSPALARVQADNAELEAQIGRARAGEPAEPMPELTAANEGVERAERLSKGFEQAAACLAMRA